MKFIKSFINGIKFVFVSVKGFFTGIYNFFKGIIAFIKGFIDFIYKMFFIAFFCVVVYVGYQVFSSASTINKKLDELQTNLKYVKQISEDLSKATDKISSFVKDPNKEIKKAGEQVGDSVAKTADKINNSVKKKTKFVDKIKNLI